MEVSVGLTALTMEAPTVAERDESATETALIVTALETEVAVPPPLGVVVSVPVCAYVNVEEDGTEAMVNVPLKLVSDTPAMMTDCPTEKPCGAVVVIVTTFDFRTAPFDAMVAAFDVGGEAGAMYNPLALIVPTLAFPFAMPLTNQLTAVFELPVTFEVN